MRAEERIAELNALVERQREQIAVLLARVRDLEARLAKDSHTSGKPPASDGLARKTRSLRKHSGKKPGGQLGHRGERLRREVVPDEVIAHRPPVCAASRQPPAAGGRRTRPVRELMRVNVPALCRRCERYACDIPSLIGTINVPDHRRLNKYAKFLDHVRGSSS